MELEQLQHFIQVADSGSFTKAALASALSQSSLSRSIAKLEDELGKPLFDRQSRNVVLTDAGRMLLERARLILSLAEDAKDEVADDGQTGTVRIGAIPTIAPYFLPTPLKVFQQEHPNARVLVQEDTTDQLLKKLADGIVDIAICAYPLHVKHLHTEPLFDEELFLVTADEHPLARKRSIRALDLVQLPFVLLGEAHCLSDSIVAFCRQKSFQPVAVERTSQLATVQELVALNHGISFIPEMAKRIDTDPRRTYRSLAGKPPKRTVVLVTNPYRYASLLERAFCDLLRRNS